MSAVKMNTISPKLKGLIKGYQSECQTLINLNASENYTSPLIKQILGNHASYDFYPFPPVGGFIQGPWLFSAPCYFNQLTEYLNKLGKKAFACEKIDARLKGGQAAEIAILLALANKGETVFCVSEKDGGHFGLEQIAKSIGVNLYPINFDPNTHYINIETTLSNMQAVWLASTRKLVILNQSFLLRQPNLREFSEKVKFAFPDSLLCYDISHTFGLIIGNQLTNPLEAGFDIIHGSTHKTFPGPQKAIIGYPKHLQENIKNRIDKTVSPGLQSNCGTSEVLALAATFEEMLIHGFDYAKAVCDHAKLLGNALFQKGFNCVGRDFGFTETHQVWLIIGQEQQAWLACSLLLQAGIRTYPAYLPHTEQWGLRIGTAAITRLGLQQEEILYIADFISDILLKKTAPSSVRKQVRSIMAKFPLNALRFTIPIMNDSVELCLSNR